MLHIAASSLVDQPPRCVLDVLRRGLRDERANEVVCRLFERLHRQRVAVHELLGHEDVETGMLVVPPELVEAFLCPEGLAVVLDVLQECVVPRGPP